MPANILTDSEIVSQQIQIRAEVLAIVFRVRDNIAAGRFLDEASRGHALTLLAEAESFYGSLLAS